MENQATTTEKVSKKADKPSGNSVVYYNVYDQARTEQTMSREDFDRMRGDGLLKNAQIIRYEPSESAPKVEDGAPQ